MKKLICAAMIVGDGSDKNEWSQCMESLAEGGIEHVFVNYNGKNKKFPYDKTILPLTYGKFTWEDDFALARNQSFSLVPKDEYDWIMWLDSDDRIFVDDGGFEEMIKSLDPYTVGIFLKYNYAVDPETGLVVVEQWRERVLSTRMPWTWIHPIHEVCKTEIGSQFARRENVYIEHMRKSGDDRGARVRNRRIIAKAMREYPDVPRYLFYFASETLAEAADSTDETQKRELCDAAIHAFKKYKDMTNDVDDDYYLASNRIAELYYIKKDYINAVDAFLECIAIYPEWPDAYIGAAKCCIELNDYARARSFAEMASRCAKPSTASGIEPMMVSFYPYFLRAEASFHLGDYEQAVKDFKKAKKVWNTPNGEIEGRIKEAKNALKKQQGGSEEDERLKRRGSRPEKSIAFFTAPLPFNWHPNIESGAGAERCIMQLAPRFAADGWRVAIFGTPGEHRGVDENGVEWWNSSEYNPMEPFTVFISSRSADPFKATINSAVKYLWMHDVNIGESLFPVKDRPTKIIGLTNWHTRHLMNLYGVPAAQMAVVPNGIELSRFPIDRSDDPSGDPKFIWSSSADRGLDTLLGLWPMIRSAYPGATLNVFYGWELLDKAIEMHERRGMVTSLRTFKEKIINEYRFLGEEEGGIFMRGRVDQQTLAEEMYKANFNAYPTSFLETFCITAIENQAAGVIPITSELGSLTEVIANKSTLVKGWPMNADYQVRYLKVLDNYLNNEELRLETRRMGRLHSENFSWDNAYSKWNNLFTHTGISLS